MWKIWVQWFHLPRKTSNCISHLLSKYVRRIIAINLLYNLILNPRLFSPQSLNNMYFLGISWLQTLQVDPCWIFVNSCPGLVQFKVYAGISILCWSTYRLTESHWLNICAERIKTECVLCWVDIVIRVLWSWESFSWCQLTKVCIWQHMLELLSILVLWVLAQDQASIWKLKIFVSNTSLIQFIKYSRWM